MSGAPRWSAALCVGVWEHWPRYYLGWSHADRKPLWLVPQSYDILLLCPSRGAKYCDELICMFIYLFVCLLVCLSVCLPAGISDKLGIQISPNFLDLLPVAMARSSSDGSAIRYVVLILWMTSCFYIMKGPESKTTHMFCWVRHVVAPGAKSAVSDCWLITA